MNPYLLGYDSDNEPIWLMRGAEEPEETEEEETEEEETEEEEEGDDEEERKHPPSGKTKDAKTPAKKASKSAYRPPSEREWANTKAALAKANKEQQAIRKAALEKAKKEGMNEAAAEARVKALEEAESEWKPRAIRGEARAMLAEMRCKNPGRLLKLIDPSTVTVDGDNLIGLEDQVNGLKEEWPELFVQDTDENKKPDKKTAAPARRVGAAAGNSKKEEQEEKPKTGASRIAGRLLGQSS